MITPERLWLYPRALFVALVLAFVIAVASAGEVHLPMGGRLGGDYPAFHAAGVLVREGRGASLYDPAQLAAVQADLFPGAPPGTWLAFAYPAAVALPYAALSVLGFKGAYVAHTVLAATALWLVAGIAGRWLPALAPHRFLVFVALLSFYPLLRAVFGGQNTPFALLVLAAAWWAESRDRPVAQGAIGALLLCKPQLGLPLVILQALRRPPTLAGAVPVAVAIYGAGVAAAGPAWPAAWLRALPTFQQTSHTLDAANDISLLGVSQALLPAPAGTAIGIVAISALAAALAVLWRSAAPTQVRWGLTAVFLVVLPPHSLFYDAGLAGLALLVFAGTGASWRTAWGWALGLTGAAGPVVGFQPLVIVLGMYAAWLARPARGVPS